MKEAEEEEEAENWAGEGGCGGMKGTLSTLYLHIIPDQAACTALPGILS